MKGEDNPSGSKVINIFIKLNILYIVLLVNALTWLSYQNAFFILTNEDGDCRHIDDGDYIVS